MSAVDYLDFEFLSVEFVDVTAHQPFAYCGDELGLECDLSFKLFSIHGEEDLCELDAERREPASALI